MAERCQVGPLWKQSSWSSPAPNRIACAVSLLRPYRIDTISITDLTSGVGVKSLNGLGTGTLSFPGKAWCIAKGHPTFLVTYQHKISSLDGISVSVIFILSFQIKSGGVGFF